MPTDQTGLLIRSRATRANALCALGSFESLHQNILMIVFPNKCAGHCYARI